MILEGIADAVKRKWDGAMWTSIRKKAGIKYKAFQVHRPYSETVPVKIVRASVEITGRPADELMELFGMTFVLYISKFGYDRILRVLGRTLVQFINGLDNLHEYLRASYVKMKPPSFFCEDETRYGLTLHYRSKRRGYVYYVMGQIATIAKLFFNTPVEMELLTEDESMDMTHVTMRLHFENLTFVDTSKAVEVKTDADGKEIEGEEKKEEDGGGLHESGLEVDSKMFFDVFPFHIVFDSEMIIINIGSGIKACMPYCKSQSIDEMFAITRPTLEFTIENIKSHTNCVFEMITVDAIRKQDRYSATGTGGSGSNSGTMEDVEDTDYDPDDQSKCLRVKGQMFWMEEWNAILFLGTPVMDGLEKMFHVGLFVNDLSMHDSSRDLVLAGSQQAAELKMATDTETEKTALLDTNASVLTNRKKRATELVYYHTPILAYGHLTGKDARKAEAYCANHPEVSVVYCELEGFNTLLKSNPLQLAILLNTISDQFERLCEKHKLFMLDLGSSCWAAVSGAPIETKFSTVYCADLAIELINVANNIRQPDGNAAKAMISIHTGLCMAGLAGIRTPRYDYYGHVIATAEILCKSSQGNKTLLSEAAKRKIEDFPFDITDAGLECKDSTGTMSVTGHWLAGKQTAGPVWNTLDDSSFDEMPGMMSLSSKMEDTSDMFECIPVDEIY